MSESKFFEQGPSKETRDPVAITKLRELRKKAEGIRNRIEAHKAQSDKLYSNLNKLNKTAEVDQKVDSAIRLMKSQHDLALRNEEEDLVKIEAEIQGLEKHIRNTLNIEPSQIK